MISLEMAIISVIITSIAFGVWQLSFAGGVCMFWFLLTLMGIADWIVNSVWFGRIEEQDREEK